MVVTVPDQVYVAREHWPQGKAGFTRAHFEKAFAFLKEKGVTVLDATALVEERQKKGGEGGADTGCAPDAGAVRDDCGEDGGTGAEAD